MRFVQMLEEWGQTVRRKKVKQLIARILLALEIANVMSFTATRFLSKPAAQLERIRAAEPGERMNYLIAGTFNHPDTAFELLLDSMEGGVTFVKFSPMGWSALQMAGALRKDIVEHDYRPVVYSISVGDKVARWLEWEMPMTDLKVVSMNPCPSPDMLKPSIRRVAKFMAPAYRALCYALGWISVIPYFPSAGGKFDYSMILLADQMKELMRDDAPYEIGRTIGIIESTKDELLENSKISDYFGEIIPCLVVDANHADTVKCADEYKEAMRRIEELADNQNDQD